MTRKRKKFTKLANVAVKNFNKSLIIVGGNISMKIKVFNSISDSLLDKINLFIDNNTNLSIEHKKIEKDKFATIKSLVDEGYKFDIFVDDENNIRSLLITGNIPLLPWANKSFKDLYSNFSKENCKNCIKNKDVKVEDDKIDIEIPIVFINLYSNYNCALEVNSSAIKHYYLLRNEKNIEYTIGLPIIYQYEDYEEINSYYFNVNIYKEKVSDINSLFEGIDYYTAKSIYEKNRLLLILPFRINYTNDYKNESDVFYYDKFRIPFKNKDDDDLNFHINFDDEKHLEVVDNSSDDMFDITIEERCFDRIGYGELIFNFTCDKVPLEFFVKELVRCVKYNINFENKIEELLSKILDKIDNKLLSFKLCRIFNNYFIIKEYGSTYKNVLPWLNSRNKHIIPDINIDENNKYAIGKNIAVSTNLCLFEHNEGSFGNVMIDELFISLLKNFIMKDLSNMALIEMVNTKNNIKGINYNPEKKILYFDKIYLNYYLLLMQGIFDIRIDYALVDTFDKKLLTKQFEEQFVKNMSLYREISDFESKEKNNNLADMLNTIQIASIALTILGWVLVIYQGNIPNNILMYIIAIIICAILSIIFAMFIKSRIKKNNE